MRKNCKEWIFRRCRFSADDAGIERVAESLDGPKSSTTWRQINTTYHVTRVVTDLALVRAVAIFIREAKPASTLFSLIE